MSDFIDRRKDNPRKRNMSPKLRFEILRRDGFTCQYCGKTGNDAELEIDHITPFSKGGTNDEGNLITSCFDCNRGKRDTEIVSSNEPIQLKSSPSDEIEMMFNLAINGTITINTLRTHFNGKLKNTKDPVNQIKKYKKTNYCKGSIDLMNRWYSKDPEYMEHTLKFGDPFDQLLACMCIGTMSINRDDGMIRSGMHI